MLFLRTCQVILHFRILQFNIYFLYLLIIQLTMFINQLLLSIHPRIDSKYFIPEVTYNIVCQRHIGEYRLHMAPVLAPKHLVPELVHHLFRPFIHQHFMALGKLINVRIRTVLLHHQQLRPANVVLVIEHRQQHGLLQVLHAAGAILRHDELFLANQLEVRVLLLMVLLWHVSFAKQLDFFRIVFFKSLVHSIFQDLDTVLVREVYRYLKMLVRYKSIVVIFVFR